MNLQVYLLQSHKKERKHKQFCQNIRVQLGYIELTGK